MNWGGNTAFISFAFYPAALWIPTCFLIKCIRSSGIDKRQPLKFHQLKVVFEQRSKVYCRLFCDETQITYSTWLVFWLINSSSFPTYECSSSCYWWSPMVTQSLPERSTCSISLKPASMQPAPCWGWQSWQLRQWTCSRTSRHLFWWNASLLTF